MTMCDIKLFCYLVLINCVLGKSGTEYDGLIKSPENNQCSRKDERENTKRKISARSLIYRKLIIDTDAGSDDGVAILNILAAEDLFQEVEVRLITTVYGNTNVDNVSRNVLKILKTVNRLDIPVHKGASQSLVATPKIDNYFGEDGFGDFHFPSPPSDDLVKTNHAVLALIEEVNLHPGELTLMCIGPLTNIALALRLDPTFFNKLKDIYVLGGSDSGVGNIKPGIEFNFYVDPEAALIVLKEAEKSKKILTLLTWETLCMRSPVEMEWRINVLGTLKGPKVDLINKAEGITLEGENWISADTVLSSIVINPNIIESSDIYHADVEISGHHSRGVLFVDFNHVTNLTKNIRLVKKIKVEEHKRLLLQNFDSSGLLENSASKN